MFFLTLTFCVFTLIHGILWGEQNRDVILACSFKPAGSGVIHWTTSDSKNVHSYYKTEDQLQNQDKSYSGRTFLFLDQISKGNASLQIRTLKKSDANTYKCYVSTSAGITEHEIILQIKGAVLGRKNKDVILPCTFKPSEEELIHWTTSDKKNVHSYYKTKDQLEKQDKDYSGRTSLFLNELSKGNASLQIRVLKKSDENTYKCYVSTKGGITEDEISLQVVDLQHTMEYEWGDNGVRNLTCSVTDSRSEDITITWNVNNKMVREDKSNKSSFTVQNNSTHQCIIKHSIVQGSWTGTWKMNDPITMKDNSITCGCNFRENTDFYTKWNFRNYTKEVTIVSRSNSMPRPNISANYEARINYDNYDLNLTKLRDYDNGLYICLIEREEKMDIEMTQVNITVEKETENRSRLYICIAFIPGVLMVIISYVKCNQNSQI